MPSLALRALLALLHGLRLAFADIATLTKLTDPAARCMDGTLGGFYHQRASVEASKAKWVIHMQGGGEVSSQTSTLPLPHVRARAC